MMEVALPDDLGALVRLSAALAGGLDRPWTPHMREAARVADPDEVEEVLLQSYLFLGYPVALTALADWRRVSGRPAPAERPEDWEAWARRGARVCRRVYGDAYEGLRANIAELSPGMDRWMVVEGYGKVLGRAGLPLWRRECCISALLIVIGATPQLRSHLRGALRTGTPVPVLECVVETAAAMTSPPRRARAREVWTTVKNRWEET